MAMIIHPETELGKELAKWEKPYKYEPFPKMLYRANRRPDGKPSVCEADDRLFGGQPGAAELWSAACQMTVHDERELTKFFEMGWRESPKEAMDFFEAREKEVGNVAAARAFEDRNMSDKAKAEAKAAEDATAEHVPEVPRKPVRRRGRPRKGT